MCFSECVWVYVHALFIDSVASFNIILTKTQISKCLVSPSYFYVYSSVHTQSDV